MTGERFVDYHVKNQPHFDTFEMKGGGDAVSAARAVLQTGEFDYAWSLQVEDEVLKRMETGGRGRVLSAASGNVEFIILNTTDPWTEVDGERSSVKTKHPTLNDPKIRQAINLLLDRDSIERFIYGRATTRPMRPRWYCWALVWRSDPLEPPERDRRPQPVEA